MRKLLLQLRDALQSIASLPSLIFFAFVALAFYQLSTTDESPDLPDRLEPFNLSDLDTIRTTLSAVITGVFTLTVFAYSMVMNVLDRSISSYSPRLIPLVLSERYHQEILGVSAGTIAHSGILLLGVAEPPDRLHPPLLAAASAILFALLSLILFIYFIHRVSQSIFVNSLLRMSFRQTAKHLQLLADLDVERSLTSNGGPAPETHSVRATTSGYLHEIDYRGLLDSSARLGTTLHLRPRPGAFVYEGDVVVSWSQGKGQERQIARTFTISGEEPTDVYANGFRHLVEVAIKAASPAINDPATSMTAVHYLGQLFGQLARIKPYNQLSDAQGTVHLNDWQPAELLQHCFNELHRYLANDPWGRDVLRHTLHRIETAYGTDDQRDGLTTARSIRGSLVDVPQ